jgi:hypothetical protein
MKGYRIFPVEWEGILRCGLGEIFTLGELGPVLLIPNAALLQHFYVGLDQDST